MQASKYSMYCIRNFWAPCTSDTVTLSTYLNLPLELILHRVIKNRDYKPTNCLSNCLLDLLKFIRHTVYSPVNSNYLRIFLPKNNLLVKKMKSLLFYFFLVCIATSVQSLQVIVDTDADLESSREWLDASCVYAVNYHDYFAFGCPVDLEGENDIYPGKVGYWKACQDTCSMLYYGGLGTKAQSLSIHAFLKGSSEIIVMGRMNPLNTEDEFVIANISFTADTWFTEDIDLTPFNYAYVSFLLDSCKCFKSHGSNIFVKW